ncbi:MAG: hypothetical protein CME71_00745 [Halobacteriovorax sp.]|nr:hypothetical protein [Halobacteriovorax sp.]
MKKPNFSGLKSRMKNLFKFGSKKSETSVDEFEDRYYDETDPEADAEDVLSSENYEDYEEDDLDDLPPQQMEIPRPEIDSPPDLPNDEISSPAAQTGPATLPGGTSPKELKLKLGKAKQSFREKMSQRFKPGTSGFKMKLANAFKRGESSKFNTRAIKEWWNKVGGEDLLLRPFKPEVRPTIHHAFLWLIFATVAVQGGKMLALVMTPKQAASKAPLSISSAAKNDMDIDVISRGDIFGAKGDVRNEELIPKKPINQNIICKTADQKSSLPLELLNTVVLKDSVKSIASVQTRGSREFMNVREGDKVQNLAEVGKINRLRLILKNLSTGECEFIEGTEKEKDSRTSPIKVVSANTGRKIIEKQAETGIKNEGNRFTIKKSMRDELLTNNMAEVLTQARVVQLKRPDGTLAFKMTEIVPGSIYAKLNIQDGDVITGINGKPFNNLNEVMTLFSKIRDIDNFQISMERGGMDQTQEYNFE